MLYSEAVSTSISHQSRLISKNDLIPQPDKLLQGLYQYLPDENWSRADLQQSTKVLTLLYLVLMPANRLTQKEKSFMPTAMVMFDQKECNLLMRHLMWNIDFYEGTHDQPIDLTFQQKTLAILLRTIITPAGRQEPYSLGGYFFRDAAKLRLTISAVKKVFYIKFISEIGGWNRWLQNGLPLKFFGFMSPLLCTPIPPKT
ncbi:MAG: hypothetical protein H7240_07430 [Glaciimonas sp.]|nr:hypothetical protein [Glaciimonas sp.]